MQLGSLVGWLQQLDCAPASTSKVEGELKKWHSLALPILRVLEVSHQFARTSSVSKQIYFVYNVVAI